MIVLRRVLVIFAVAFWIGGFTFYAAVVIPIGTEVLGGPAQQGDITRYVSNWINVAGAVALVLWAWDLAADPALPRLRQCARWFLWVFMAVALALLVWWHPQLDTLRDSPEYTRDIQRLFRRLHRLYLWTSTFQWAAALLLLFSTLRTWRHNDSNNRQSSMQFAIEP
jgi:hypothetical protein